MRKILSCLACLCMLGASAFAADTVPWTNDFSNYSNSITGWKQGKIYSSSRGFTVSGGALYLNQAPSNKYNEAYIYFSADGFEFEGGKSYRFGMTGRTIGTAADAQYLIKVGLYKKEGTAVPDINNPVGDYFITIDKLTTETLNFGGYFEVEETGEYYLGIYVYDNYSARSVYFDDFVLVEESIDAPAEPQISVVPDAKGILKAEVTATASTRTIRGTEISEVSKMVVYRDGGEVKTFTDLKAGESVTFTDYVAQPGNHTYAAVCYNEKGSGARKEVISGVGGVPETRSWLNYKPYAAKYTPEGTIRIEWPASTGVDSTAYRIETLSGRVIEGTPEPFITKDYTKDNAEIKHYYVVDSLFEAGDEPIGWQYKVSKVDEAGEATHLGYTNYICLNNQIPYYPTTASENSLDAFSLDNDYQYAWQRYGDNGGYIGTTVSRPYGIADKTYFYHNWLISPGLLLSKDKFYRVKITGCSDSGTTTYTIKAGKGSYREALDIVVAENHPTLAGGSSMTKVQTDEMFLSVPDDGQYFIGIMGSIPNATSSDALRLRRFDIIEVDPALPNVPTDVKVNYSDRTITFCVPELAINGDSVKGIDKIEVLKNGELYETITEGLTPGAELSIDIEVKAGVPDVYAIRAYNAAGQGESASAKVFVLSTPYTNDFNNKEALDGYTLINNLGTRQNFHIQNDQVRLFYDEAGSDHWLITPPITLTAGQYYQMNYIARASADGAGHMEVMLANAAVQDSMKTTISERFELNTEKNIFGGLHEDWFTVEENGQYYIGFHVTHDPGRHNHEVYLDDLTVYSGTAGTAPDRGTLIVEPAADGALTAQLTYTAPTRSLNGDALNANSTVGVSFFINGVQTGGIQPDGTANPTSRTFNTYPGQTISITVAVDEELPYIFSARSNWNGRVTYQDAFVGINRPAYPDPESIVLTETQPYGHVKMSWDAVTTDVEGYPLNPDNLVYEVKILVPNPANPENYVEQDVLTNIKGTECEFDAIDKDAAQTMKRYVLRARNTKGEGSQGVLTGYINVGKPYRMPYRESFAADKNKPGVKTAIFSETLEGMINWGLMYDGIVPFISGAADGDGCYLAMEALGIGSKGRFFTGKVNLGSGINPSMSMMLYNYGNAEDSKVSENLIEFQVYSYGDRRWHSLGEAKTVNELCKGRPGWNKVTVDLADFADQVVICGIDATCINKTFTPVDNIQITELPLYDMTLNGAAVPVSVVPGVNFTVEATVINNGLIAAAPQSVEMLVDSVVVATLEGIELAVDSVAIYTFTHAFPSVDTAESHELTFRVNCTDDADETNNAAWGTVAMLDINLPGVENPTATNDDDFIVTLSWDAPKALPAEAFTESFEDFTAGHASQYGWTAYDGDKQAIWGVNNGAGQALEIPGLPAGEPASFAVIDNENGPFSASAFPARDGNKFLMSIVPNAETGSTDDWMISPLLSGNAQTISFWVNNNYSADFEALYSEGGMNLNSFKSLGTATVSAREWCEIKAEVPAGAKRFAIRNTTYCDGGFMFMVDDITYEPATGDEVALLGYNIYSEDTEVVAQTAETTFTFAEAMAEGEHVFGISARYAHGESHIQAVKFDVHDGIAEISAAQGIYIFGGNGCINVCNAEGLQVAIYDVAGKLINAGTVSAAGRIAAAPGAYVVTVGGKTAKVIVK